MKEKVSHDSQSFPKKIQIRLNSWIDLNRLGSLVFVEFNTALLAMHFGAFDVIVHSHWAVINFTVRSMLLLRFFCQKWTDISNIIFIIVVILNIII